MIAGSLKGESLFVGEYKLLQDMECDGINISKGWIFIIEKF